MNGSSMTHGTAFLPNPELKLYPVSPFVFRAHVLLLIDLLERNRTIAFVLRSQTLLGKPASGAQKVSVVDWKRIAAFPLGPMLARPS